VIREDLSRVLTPFSPDDLRVSFVDAESVLDSAREPDPELVSMLRRKSGFDAFVDGFNDFVRSKGLMGRYTTSLYQLEQVLQEAISAVTIGDDDVARLETVLLQQRRALLDTKSEIPRSVAERVTRVTENIRSLGRDLADSIDGELKEAEFAAKIENAQRRTDELVDELVEDVLRTIESRLANLAEHFSAIARSQVSTELLASLGRRIPVMNGVVVGVVGAGTAHLGDAGKIVAGLGQFLVQNAFHGKGDGFGAIFDLKEYSGTLVHDGIKWGGKLLGKKFRPWEAVKMTKNVAHLGRAMVIVGPIVSIIFQAKQDADAKKREIALREGRAQVRASFNEAAQVVEMHFDEATGAYIAASLQPDIARLDTQIAELRSMQSTKSAAFDALSDLLDQVRNLIREMHGSPSFINRVSAS
jgi:hypothetical protein